ncbi:MAG: CapA family protein [Bacteroidota bacterium]|nr:CapA family protein [Bacteroidota bacterium]
MKAIITFILFMLCFSAFGQKNDSSLNLIFTGDIMVHGDQLKSAWYADDTAWNFRVWFEDVEGILQDADFCIGNLEQPLGVKPFKGYPSFGSPVKLAVDLKNAGFDVLLTANNHAFDRRKKGVIKTIDVLDSLGIHHTGTFKSQKDRTFKVPLVLEKNGIRLAVLNYAYGSNYNADETMLSVMKTDFVKKEVEAAKILHPDKIVAVMHWGNEYKSFPNDVQKQWKDSLLLWGVDYIIGAHPHVLQPMKWDNSAENESFVAWSLGNFISNMYFKRTDGGALLHLTLSRQNGEVSISDAAYDLMYVYKYRDDNQHIQYRLRPVQMFMDKRDAFKADSYDKMIKYKSFADTVMKHNINVHERKFKNNTHE